MTVNFKLSSGVRPTKTSFLPTASAQPKRLAAVSLMITADESVENALEKFLPAAILMSIVLTKSSSADKYQRSSSRSGGAPSGCTVVLLNPLPGTTVEAEAFSTLGDRSSSCLNA